MHSDTETITALQQGDQNALATLYDKYGAALYGVVLRIVESEEVAEEVIQETFLKIWKNASYYNEDKGKFFTWALNIARNTAIDATRSKGLKKQRKTKPFDFLVNSEYHPVVGDAIDTIGLREIVEKLDEKHRKVIDLAYFKGYTQTEIEEELNIPIGTVKTRLRLALRELRKIFSR